MFWFKVNQFEEIKTSSSDFFTLSPIDLVSFITSPDIGEGIEFSIFIASRTTNGCPISTLCPISTR